MSSYVWLGGLGAAMTVAVLMVVSMFGSVVGALAKAPSSLLVVPFVALGVMVLVVVVFAVVFLVQWLSWKHLSYELLPEEFNLYSGILNKKRRHVPYQRVQSVNQQAGVLQRILGVCDVKIDTAGGASNDAIMLKFVQTFEAEALRSEIFRRKKILLAGGAVDEFGNAFVSGMVVPSAWMMANAAGDERAVRIAFGEDPASVQASAAFAAADARVASTAAQLSGNVLDGADEVLQDIRGVFGGRRGCNGVRLIRNGIEQQRAFLRRPFGRCRPFRCDYRRHHRRGVVCGADIRIKHSGVDGRRGGGHDSGNGPGRSLSGCRRVGRRRCVQHVRIGKWRCGRCCA